MPKCPPEEISAIITGKTREAFLGPLVLATKLGLTIVMLPNNRTKIVVHNVERVITNNEKEITPDQVNMIRQRLIRGIRQEGYKVESTEDEKSTTESDRHTTLDRCTAQEE